MHGPGWIDYDAPPAKGEYGDWRVEKPTTFKRSHSNRTIPTCSVVVVSADSGQSLRECVRRILASNLQVELILIDNGSDDGQPEAVERAFQNEERLRVVYNRANLGFGPAANRGAAMTRGRFIAIVNPDCLLEPDDLPRMVDIATNDPDTGVVGAVVCDLEGRPDPASRRRDPTVARVINTLLGRKGQGVAVPGPMPDRPAPEEAISGALMLFPRAVYQRVSGFDEGYFLHFEDLDLCRRLRDVGYRVILAGDLHVQHGKGGSSRHRPVFVSRFKHRGMWRWFRQHDALSRSPVLSAFVWLAIWTHFVVMAPWLWLRRRRR